jgi:hypothetical protein
MRANAIDMDCNDRFNLPTTFKKILQSNLRWKQLMIEGVTTANPKGGWIHCAYDSDIAFEDQKMDIKVVRFLRGNDGIMHPNYQDVTLEEAIIWCDQNIA